MKFLSGQISTHTERHTHQHWVQTGPHVMIVGGAAREMLSAYRRDLDVKDPTQPFVMFPGKLKAARASPVRRIVADMMR